MSATELRAECSVGSMSQRFLETGDIKITPEISHPTETQLISLPATDALRAPGRVPALSFLLLSATATTPTSTAELSGSPQARSPRDRMSCAGFYATCSRAPPGASTQSPSPGYPANRRRAPPTRPDLWHGYELESGSGDLPRSRTHPPARLRGTGPLANSTVSLADRSAVKACGRSWRSARTVESSFQEPLEARPTPTHKARCRAAPRSA